LAWSSLFYTLQLPLQAVQRGGGMRSIRMNTKLSISRLTLPIHNAITAADYITYRRKCGQQASDSAGEQWRRQHKTEQGRDEWSVACDIQGINQITAYPA